MLAFPETYSQNVHPAPSAAPRSVPELLARARAEYDRLAGLDPAGAQVALERYGQRIMRRALNDSRLPPLLSPSLPPDDEPDLG